MTHEGDNRLPALVNEAAQAHKDSVQFNEKAADRALDAGAALVEAKALCRHGEWGAWLQTTGIPERSAQRYMKLSRSGLKSDTVSDLGLSQALSVAGAIEALWPQANCGRTVSGSSGGERLWAVIFRPSEAEFAFYAMVHFYGVGDDSFGFGTGGQAVAMNKPIAPLGLALGHLREAGAVRLSSHIEFPADEANEWFGTVGARLVSHSWGMRLEAM